MHGNPGDPSYQHGSGGGGSSGGKGGGGRLKDSERTNSRGGPLRNPDSGSEKGGTTKTPSKGATGATSGGERGGKLTPEARAHAAGRLATASQAALESQRGK